MYKFIFLTFAFLAWAFYEMSGGASFAPTERVADAGPVAASDSVEVKSDAVMTATAEPAVQPAAEVTRAAYTAPSYNIQAPAEAELAAVDPAVLASFSNVLKSEGADVTSDATQVAADGGLIAGQALNDLREVTGNRVNMRNGPGTSYSIVGRLERGDAVEVLSEPGNGWLKLRVSETGRIGWMADFLVSDAD